MMRSQIFMLLLVSLAAVSLAACGGRGDDASGDEMRTSESGDLTALSPDFAVFSGERGAEDEVPAGLIPGQVAAMLKLELDEARYSRELRDGPLFLVPAPRLICMYTDIEAVGSCWLRRTIRDGRSVASTLCGPGLSRKRIVTFGVVPDGVREVTILRSDIPDVTVPVQGNAFVAWTSSVPPLPVQVSWEQEGKRLLRSSGIPPKVAREGC
jgi:hypothetical protein